MFGFRKDEVFREVFDLGALYVLEKECGLRFDRESTGPNVQPSLKSLKRIRERMLREQRQAVKAITRSKSFCICGLKTHNPSHGFVFSAEFFSKKNRKRRKTGHNGP